MEKRTSEVFKEWMTCELPIHDPVAQGTAEDRVTAVNNEVARTSLTKNLSVFDKDGTVVYDLLPLLTHVKTIKHLLDHGHWDSPRNKYGLGSFIPFVKWLLKHRQLNTYNMLKAYFDDPDLDRTIPHGNTFKVFLVAKYGALTPNAYSILSRVKRVLRVASHAGTNISLQELQTLIVHMDDYVDNEGSIADCKTAVRHYIKALTK